MRKINPLRIQLNLQKGTSGTGYSLPDKDLTQKQTSRCEEWKLHAAFKTKKALPLTGHLQNTQQLITAI